MLTDKQLRIVAYVAFALIVIRQSLRGIPEFVPFGEEFGEVIYDAGIGYIVTYWFYFLTIVRPRANDKRKVYGFVTQKHKQVYSNTKELIDHLGHIMRLHVPFEEVSLQDLKLTLRHINLDSASGYSDSRWQPMSWRQLIKAKCQIIKTSIRDALVVMPHLDVDDIVLLTKIFDSPFFTLVENMNSDYDGIEFLAEPLDELINDIKEMDKRIKNI